MWPASWLIRWVKDLWGGSIPCKILGKKSLRGLPGSSLDHPLKDINFSYDIHARVNNYDNLSRFFLAVTMLNNYNYKHQSKHLLILLLKTQQIIIILRHIIIIMYSSTPLPTKRQKLPIIYGVRCYISISSVWWSFTFVWNYLRKGYSSGRREWLRQVGHVLCSLNHDLMHCMNKNSIHQKIYTKNTVEWQIIIYVNYASQAQVA